MVGGWALRVTGSLQWLFAALVPAWASAEDCAAAAASGAWFRDALRLL